MVARFIYACEITSMISLKYKGIRIKSKTTRKLKRIRMLKKAHLYLRIWGHIYLNILENKNIRAF